MLVNSLHHPLLHDAFRMWAMNINIGSRRIILESHARSRRRAFSMFLIAEIRQKTQRFFIRKVLRFLLESLN